MTGLRERSDALLRTAVGRARKTETGYASDWRIFKAWCTEAGRSALPATSETLRFFVTWELDDLKRRVTTVRRHLASIVDTHRREGHELPSTADARKVISNVRRERREQPQGKLALEAPDLVRVAEACDCTTNSGCRDRALVVTGFATALRRSELARVQLSDVKFVDEGIRVKVPYSKTDQAGVGRTIDVWPGLRESTDPVRVLNAWISRRGRWEGPLFVRIQHGDAITRLGISGDSVADTVKRAVIRAKIDAAGYAAHSLRAGAVTASSEIGRSSGEIMTKLSGHRDVAMVHKYNRGRRAFAGRNPLEGVL